MLTPIGKKILIKPIEQKTGSLFLTNVKPSQFTVIAIGDEVTKVKSNDTIFIQNHHFIEIDHNNEKFLIIEESAVLAKLDE